MGPDASNRSSSEREIRMLAQHTSHTAPSSGRCNGEPHAAHGGSKSAARMALSDVRKFDASGAAPEPIEAVEIAGVLREHVDDEVEVVEQNPLGAGVALHQRR